MIASSDPYASSASAVAGHNNPKKVVSMSQLKRLPKALMALAAVSGLLLSAGCSSDSPTGGYTGDSQSSEAAVADAEAQAATAMNGDDAQWAQPSAPFAPGSGKVALIPSGLAGGNVVAVEQMKQAADTIGWEATVFDGEFNPSTQAGHVQRATVENYDAIILYAVDTQNIQSAVDAALAKNIPIVCNECFDREGITNVSIDWEAAGENMGAYIVSNSDCSTKIAAFPDAAYPTVSAYLDGLIARTEALCPGIEIDETPFPTSDISKPGPPTWTAYLASHPAGSFDWAATAYDNQAVPFAQTLADQGREDVRITSLQSALPETIEDIESGTSAFESTIFLPQEYKSWASLDLAARLVTGAPLWDASKLPTLLVDKDNIASVAESKEFVPNFDYKTMFEEQWVG